MLRSIRGGGSGPTPPLTHVNLWASPAACPISHPPTVSRGNAPLVTVVQVCGTMFRTLSTALQGKCTELRKVRRRRQCTEVVATACTPLPECAPLSLPQRVTTSYQYRWELQETTRGTANTNYLSWTGVGNGASGGVMAIYGLGGAIQGKRKPLHFFVVAERPAQRLRGQGERC